MVKRAMAIAEQEGLGGAEMAEWVELATACKWNFRDVLTEVEKGVMCRDSETVVEVVKGVSVDVAGPSMDWDSMMAEMLV